MDREIPSAIRFAVHEGQQAVCNLNKRGEGGPPPMAYLLAVDLVGGYAPKMTICANSPGVKLSPRRASVTTLLSGTSAYEGSVSDLHGGLRAMCEP
jgi:hypothetical protein